MLSARVNGQSKSHSETNEIFAVAAVNLFFSLIRFHLCSVEEQADKFVVTADVPGFDKQNIKVNVDDNNILTIKAEQTKEWQDQSKDKRYLRAERRKTNMQAQGERRASSQVMRFDQQLTCHFLSFLLEFCNLRRSLRIPKGVDASKIAASYENGVLHVSRRKERT